MWSHSSAISNKSHTHNYSKINTTFHAALGHCHHFSTNKQTNKTKNNNTLFECYLFICIRYVFFFFCILLNKFFSFLNKNTSLSKKLAHAANIKWTKIIADYFGFRKMPHVFYFSFWLGSFLVSFFCEIYFTSFI